MSAGCFKPCFFVCFFSSITRSGARIAEGTKSPKSQLKCFKIIMSHLQIPSSPSPFPSSNPSSSPSSPLPPPLSSSPSLLPIVNVIGLYNGYFDMFKVYKAPLRTTSLTRLGTGNARTPKERARQHARTHREEEEGGGGRQLILVLIIPQENWTR